jgi:hypothetical protein
VEPNAKMKCGLPCSNSTGKIFFSFSLSFYLLASLSTGTLIFGNDKKRHDLALYIKRGPVFRIRCESFPSVKGEMEVYALSPHQIAKES